ncbi:MAG TPA: M48 family metalloprotease [Caulobacteraceae bacterium]|nr:M48 family metalloprotease [Caulobacteraceae bacterium]
MSALRSASAHWARAAIGALAMAGALASPMAAARAQDNVPPDVIRDTEIEAILHQEMDPVFAAANLDPKSVRVYVINDPDPNAFTMSGYNMFVTSSLIMLTKTPDELEGVLAHETGHMARGDVAHSAMMGHVALGPMIAGLGLGLLAAVAGAPEAAAALIYSGSYFGELNALAYSREQEARADQAAVTYLEKAGYSAKGLVDFFNNLRYQEVFDDVRKYKYFVDHPLTDDRIEALTVRAESEPHWSAKDSPQSIAAYDLMKAKLKGFLDRPYQTFAEVPETDKSFDARYERAFAYYKELDTGKSLKLIDGLAAEQPNDPYLYEQKAVTLLETGKAAEAEAPARRAVELKPDAPLLRVLLGQVLLAENDHAKLDEAIMNFNRALILDGGSSQASPDTSLGSIAPLAWQYLSEAYDAKGMGGMARLAAAEQNFNLGQMQDAAILAVRARHLLQKDTPEWRRATDIILASKPSPQELKALGEVG